MGVGRKTVNKCINIDQTGYRIVEDRETERQRERERERERQRETERER